MKYNLTSSDASADKETFHAEFDLTGSEIAYTSGDALGIYPLNNPPEVQALVAALRVPGPEVPVTVPQSCYSPRPEGETMPLGRALRAYYDLKTVRPDLVKMLAGSVSSPEQKEVAEKLLEDGVSRKLHGKHVHSFRAVVQAESHSARVRLGTRSGGCVGGFFVVRMPSGGHSVAASSSATSLLFNSIFSSYGQLSLSHLSLSLSLSLSLIFLLSSMQSTESVSVCVAVVRYSLLEKPRTGVCTTYLQDRMAVGENAPVFISQNPNFRLPKNGDVPIIMIGPGTGIAPFRAFIQERG